MAKTPMQKLKEEISKEFVHAINSGSKLGMSIIIGLIRNKYEYEEDRYIKEICISFGKYLEGTKTDPSNTSQYYESCFDTFKSSISKQNESNKTDGSSSQ
jgi:hypothetical protein